MINGGHNLPCKLGCFKEGITNLNTRIFVDQHEPLVLEIGYFHNDLIEQCSSFEMF